MTMHKQERQVAPAGFEFIDYGPQEESLRDAVLAGLQQPQKSIPCRFLYDARGSKLFDQICTLPEYYPTRTETAILRARANEIADWIGPDAYLVELGSGSSTKTRIILDAMRDPAAYVPIDVSREHLRQAAIAVAEAYPDLNVTAICADYGRDFDLPEQGRRNIGFFPGSTIGNLEATDALNLLKIWRKRLGKEGGFILGADLRTGAPMLEAAYDDAAGVTEAFIRNIFTRINRELKSNIAQDGFAYEARYNSDLGRVEMRLRSTREQVLAIDGVHIPLAEGEDIHVENSHKYRLDVLNALAAQAGFKSDAVFTDPAQLFSVHLWTVAS
jgi:dimethylhistidine N-methyltransferase